MKFEYISVTVCLFSGWAEAFSCQKATVLIVAEKMLDFVFLLHQVIEAHIKELCKTVSLTQTPHCTEPLQSGKVEGPVFDG